MQAQALKADQHQAIITSQQSLQSIQTLLRAGLGCITYLRNLLPSDNFSESYLTSSGPESLSSQPSRTISSFASSDGRRNVSGFKIMTVTRGFTEEADKLLDYLESGIFDAVQKQYLRCFIFAIYLDAQDPNNIVEAYTFNFTYCRVPGSEETIPVMTLGEELMNLSLVGSKGAQDPVAEATKKGKVPTLGEVKRSLKTLIKNLIQATTQMDALPKRRFATFKLFYYDHTPDDYEPPHFRAGDFSKDKWFMTTHHEGEVPERCSVGVVHTGYHGVDVKVTSVSGFLPSGEDNNAPFLGTTDRHTFAAPPLTPAEEAAVRAQQIVAQRRDAAERRVVWDGDGGLVGSQSTGGNPSFREDDRMAPIGRREEDGTIVAVALGEYTALTDISEGHYAGQPEAVPSCIGQLAQARPPSRQQVSPTQELEETQVVNPSRLSSPTSRSPTPTPNPRRTSRPTLRRLDSSLPPSDITSSITASLCELECTETQSLEETVMIGAPTLEDDSMMLDMETQQIPAFSSREDPIQSFSEVENAPVHGMSDTPMEQTPMEQDGERVGHVDCECGVQIEDCDMRMCDGDCGRSFHLWCMGFHSSGDHRIPARFVCFDCRVKADRNWDLIVVHDLYPRMIAKFKDLAIQRRGIKVFENNAPDSLSAFTKLIGCDTTVAGQVFKRLEAEGFIAQESREVDESGFLETTSLPSKRKTKGKANAKTRASQRRRNMQKPNYVFIQAIKTEDAYKDYFNPDPEVEKRLLGLSELKPERKGRKNKNKNTVQPTDPSDLPQAGPDALLLYTTQAQVLPVNVESQTQEETQYALPDIDIQTGDLKRKTDGADEGSSNGKKKIKISLGPPVDLGD